MQKARALRPGDVVGIVSPSGRVPKERLDEGVALLESWGFRVKVGASVLNGWGYLAGTDAERAADINAMWADPTVAGVLCARGGYGAMRLLDLLDWDLIRSTPKFFCGFSDITALHAAMEQRAGLITFHGPMVAAVGGAVNYNTDGLRKAMTSAGPLGVIPWPDRPEGVGDGEDDRAPLVTIRPGVAEGRLTGGNLSLVASLVGTPWEQDLAGRIVVLEDVDEAPYRVDRMLTQLLLAGKLQKAAGIVFGDSISCMRPASDRPTFTLLEVLQDRLGALGIPVFYGFPCGHTAYRATLPFGAGARIDSEAGTLTVTEAALTR